MIRPMPRGLEARFDMTIHDIEQREAVVRMGEEAKLDAMARVGEVDSPAPPPPERETLLEQEIAEIIIGGGSNGQLKAARRILKIDRIRRALQMMDIADLSRRNPESSDAR